MFKLQGSLKRFSLIGLVFVVVGVLGASGAPLPLATVTSDLDVVRIQVQKTGIESAQVQIFDLTGRSFYQSTWSQGATLNWPLVTSGGQPVANGIYLYTLTAKDGKGQLQQQVGKLVVLRGKIEQIQQPESIPGLPTLEDLNNVESQHAGSYDVNHGATNAYNINAKYVEIGRAHV